MKRVRLLVLAGAGALLVSAPPVAAHEAPDPPAGEPDGEPQALSLLVSAVRSARSRAWSGTQHVSSWHGGTVTSAVVDVRHDAGGGTRVATAPTADRTARGGLAVPLSLPAAVPDERLLPVLDARYLLAVADDATVAGRATRVVEARRTDGQVAGRFWVDRDTGLPLRREVYDTAGHPLRSTTVVDLAVGPLTARTSPVAQLQPIAGPDPATLPGGFALFDERAVTHSGAQVLSRSYSDGLSTLTVFRQPGQLGEQPAAGFTPREVDDGTVWVRAGPIEQAVWSGSGQVFTLVSDAGPEATLPAVRALPHDRDPDDGVGARLRRGFARIGSWVNPLA